MLNNDEETINSNLGNKDEQNENSFASVIILKEALPYFIKSFFLLI